MFTQTLTARSPMAPLAATRPLRDGIRIPLRAQYLLAFVGLSFVGALWPGFILGSMLAMLLGEPWLAITGAFAIAPFGLFMSVPVSLIWLWGALGTADAIERLHR